MLDRGSRITTTIKGCGGEPDGGGEDIPYMEGKRRWLNQEAFGVTGPAAWQRQDAAHRPVVVGGGGGDANTDVSMAEDATGAHLVLKRNQADGRWVINPMFIEPLPRKESTYPCASTGQVDPNGSLGPVLREDGSVIPDQLDAVHGR